MPAAESRVTAGLRRLIFGDTDPRVRATWRVVLAWPLLWIVTGAVLAGNIQVLVDAVPAGPEQGGGLAQSVLHALFLVIVLSVWARYVDRRPLSEYGLSASPPWIREFLAGVLAIFVGSIVWRGFTTAVGGTSVEMAPSIPESSLLWGVVIPAVALFLHAAVQQVVFFRVILENAAEGLHSRGVSIQQAALGAIPVAVFFFILMHGSLTVFRLFDLAIAGSIFALLYLHTGSLALGIGAHFSGFYTAIIVSALVDVTGSPMGVIGTINQYGFPGMLIGYLLILAWLVWVEGDASVNADIPRVRSGNVPTQG